MRIFAKDEVFPIDQSKFNFDREEERKGIPFERHSNPLWKKSRPNKLGKSTFRHELYWTQGTIAQYDDNLTDYDMEKSYDDILNALSLLEHIEVDELKLALQSSISLVGHRSLHIP